MAKAGFGIIGIEWLDDDSEGETRWLSRWEEFKTLEAAKAEIGRMYEEYSSSEFGVWSNDVAGIRLVVVKGKRQTACYSFPVDLS